MSLSTLFESLKHNIHYGPAMVPFHEAVIKDIEALGVIDPRIKMLMDIAEGLVEMYNLFEATKNEQSAATSALQAPLYIAPTDPVIEAPAPVEAESEPVAVVVAVEEPVTPVAEPEPAAPVIEPVAPVAADPVPVAAPDVDKAVDLQAPPETPVAAPYSPAPAVDTAI